MIIKDKLSFLKSIDIEGDFTMIELLRAYTEKEYLLKLATQSNIKSMERDIYYLIQTFVGLDSDEIFVAVDDYFRIDIQYNYFNNWSNSKFCYKDLLKEQREEKLKRILNVNK